MTDETETAAWAAALVVSTKANPGAPFDPNVVETLEALRKQDRGAYEELRAELKKAGCRVGELDAELDRLGPSDRNEREPRQADILLNLTQDAVLFHTPDGTGYADVNVDGHRPLVATPDDESPQRLLSRWRHPRPAPSSPDQSEICHRGLCP